MAEEKRTKLKQAIIDVKVSQKDLGIKTGLALSTISEIVSGKLHDYKLSTLYKICKAIGKSPNEVLDYEEKIK